MSGKLGPIHQVEFAGVISGTTIGSCQINRLDLRSNKPWPYEVTKNGKVVCGIELCIVEDEPLGDFNSMGVDDMSSQTGALGALQSQPGAPVFSLGDWACVCFRMFGLV